MNVLLFVGFVAAVIVVSGFAAKLVRQARRERDALTATVHDMRTAVEAARFAQEVCEHTAEAWALVHPDGTVSELTPSLWRFAAPPAADAALRWADLFSPLHQARMAEALERARAGSWVDEEECAPACKDSDVRWCRVLFRRRATEGAFAPSSVLVGLLDITELKELRTLRQMGDVALNHIQDAVVALHGDDDAVVWANPAFERLTGWPREQARGRSLGELMKSTAVGEAMPSTLELVAAGGEWTGEFRSITAAGDLMLEERRVFLFDDDVAHSTRRVVILRDLSNEAATQEHLRVLMQVDVTTELPNLYGFLSNLRLRLLDAQGPNRLSVVHLDFHGCALLRETMGAAASDSVMRHLATVMSRTLRDDNLLSRVGPTQFALVLGTTNVQAIEKVLKALAVLLRAEAAKQHSDVFTSVSIGVAPGGQGVTAENLLHAAQVTSSELDPSSGVNLGYFSEQLQAELGRRLKVESALRETLKARPQELLLHFQPKVNPYKQTLVGFEALCRWRHPTLGNVPPGEFVPAAERSGLIIALGERTFEMACQAVDAWRRAGLPPRPVAINVSAHQLSRETLAEEMLALARRYDVPPRLLELEVTESAVMHDVEHAAGQLKRLRAAGFAIALDDFGTGQSSLAYLRTLPLDALKIDRSFIADIETRPDAAAICKSILELGRTLHLKVIAEGVETPGQLAFLMKNHCDVIQGWVFSKAVPADEVAAMLEDMRSTMSTMTAALAS